MSMGEREGRRVLNMCKDTGMIVVVFISLMYMALVFSLLFYVKNDWCNLLFKNFTVSDKLCKVQIVTSFF